MAQFEVNPVRIRQNQKKRQAAVASILKYVFLAAPSEQSIDNTGTGNELAL